MTPTPRPYLRAIAVGLILLLCSVTLENGTAYVIAFKPSEQVWVQNPLIRGR